MGGAKSEPGDGLYNRGQSGVPTKSFPFTQSSFRLKLIAAMLRLMKSQIFFRCRVAMAVSAGLVTGVVTAALAESVTSANTNTSRRLWKPVADEVYLQEIREKISTDKP